MTQAETAKAIAKPVGEMGGAFMLDGATYARGAELGFSGIDFYVLGRGGVLGDTIPDVVSSAFFFWNPEQVRTQWELARKVMEPAKAAVEWADLCHAYGEAHLPEFAALNRFSELAAKVCDAASPAGAALFAGWRALPAPGTDRPKARAQHYLNSLRELRGGLHGGAILKGDGVITEIKSAIRKRPPLPSEVISALTISPGSTPRINTTRFSCLATHCPPAAYLKISN